MKKLHLICNSHIDPVWMWDWEEGLGTAISTFYQAAEFCEEYDYIFCHNEAILYEFIEEHDPVLFARIQKLVKEGKWHIMGGWYLQPDCNIPSGEAVVRQIKTGLAYFKEKFNQRPTVAINFDTFGHSVGLVQILTKCGYDGYIICRPMPDAMQLPGDVFTWIGKDDSQLKVFRADSESLYCTGFGHAVEGIQEKIKAFEDEEVGAALWGVGNHGGNPSRKDFQDIAEYAKTVDFEIVHSTPEAFMKEAKSKGIHRKSLEIFIGAYTSMNSIKQKHLELEQKLFATERLCTLADINGKYRWNDKAFQRAEKILSAIAFHDVLSGTCGPDGEKSSLRKADYAIEVLNDEFNKAFFSICSDYTKADEGAFPIFVYNAQPYVRTTECEVEYLMPEPLSSEGDEYFVTVRQGDKIITSQCVHQLTNINYDRRKRIVFVGELSPLGVTRFDITVEVRKKTLFVDDLKEDIVVSDAFKTVRIRRKTGLLESYVVNGKEMLAQGAFQPLMYDDNADPWGWNMEKVGEHPIPFQLSACQNGIFENLESVRIIEEGPVYTEVESLFELGRSSVRLSYKIYKNLPEMDINIDVIWSERLKALKIKLPTVLQGEFIGQIPFGTEEFRKDGSEISAHRFVAMQDGEYAFAVYNNCTYGFSCMKNELYATLLRGVAYCAHPWEGVPLISEDRYIQSVEEGRHHFGFRLSYDKVSELENRASEFCNLPYCLNYFPHGEQAETDIMKQKLFIENQDIALTAFYKENDAYIIRLFNNHTECKDTTVYFCEKEYQLSFGKYEVKTLQYLDGQLQQIEYMC